MKEERYIFDKRIVRSHFRKYGLIMLACLPILITINILLGETLKSWVIIIIDIVVVLAVIFVVELISTNLQNKKATQDERRLKLIKDRIDKKNNS